MIRKNIDVIAVALLLAVLGVYSEAREAMLLEVVPNHGIVLAGDIIQRVWSCAPEASFPPLPSLVFSR